MKPKIDELKVALKASTAGEWETNLSTVKVIHGDNEMSIAITSGMGASTIDGRHDQAHFDADFIALAHNELPALLDYVARLEGKLEAIETSRDLSVVIENAYITGTRFDLRKHFATGWVASYSVRVEGHKRWRNIDGGGNTAVESVQDAKANLFTFSRTHKLMYGASEAIEVIDNTKR